MKTGPFAIAIVLVLAIFGSIFPTLVVAQQAVGPEFAIVPTKPASFDKQYDTNCESFFVRTSFGGGVEIVSFYYVDEKKAVKYSQSSLQDLSYNLDETKIAPMAQFSGLRGGNIIWQFNINRKLYGLFQPCLKGIKEAKK